MGIPLVRVTSITVTEVLGQPQGAALAATECWFAR